MKKRLLVLFLCVLMIVGMIPMAISAEGEATEEGSTLPSFPTENVTEVATAEELKNCFPEGVSTTMNGLNIKLTDNILDAEPLTVYDKAGFVLNIDLNGFTLQAKDIPELTADSYAKEYAFIRSLRDWKLDKTLNIFDSSEAKTGKIIPAEGDEGSGAIGFNGIINIYGGTISGWKGGANPIIESAWNTVNLYAGKIENCTSDKGLIHNHIHSGNNTDGKGVTVYDGFTFEGNGDTVLFCDGPTKNNNSWVDILGGTFKDEFKTNFVLNGEGESHVNISGGTFANDVSEYVVDGYAAVQNGDVWTVTTNPALFPTDSADITEVATVDELKTAMTNKKPNIKLTADIIGADVMRVNQYELKLDLNGHELQFMAKPSDPDTVLGYMGSTGYIIVGFGNAKFRLYDLSAEKTGKITQAANDDGSRGLIVMNNGFTYIYGGTIDGWTFTGEATAVECRWATTYFMGGKITNCTVSEKSGIVWNKTFTTAPTTGLYFYDGFEMSNNTGATFGGGDTKTYPGNFFIQGGTFNDTITTNCKGVGGANVVITGGAFKDKPAITMYDYKNLNVVKEGEMYRVSAYENTATLNADGTKHVLADGTEEDHVTTIEDFMATCTTKPICDVCREEYGETAPHNYEPVPDTAIPPTCGAAGVSQEERCVDCNALKVGTGESVDPTGEHTISEWTTDIEPTETESGWKSGQCSTCQNWVEEEIPALDGADDGAGDGAGDGANDGTGDDEKGGVHTVVIVIIVVAVVVVGGGVAAFIIIKKRK